MQLRNLLQDDDAVSPVIGVILMVAITVILAAVIASFVLGLGDTDEVAPNPSFSYDYDSSATAIEISVRGGDSFDSDQVTFSGDVSEDGQSWTEADPDLASSTTIRAGDSVELDTSPAGDAFELDIVWTSADGDTSSVVGSTSGPDS